MLARILDINKKRLQTLLRAWREGGYKNLRLVIRNSINVYRRKKRRAGFLVFLEYPNLYNNSVLSGNVMISGWAIHPNNVQSIKLLIDNKILSDEVERFLRPGVNHRYSSITEQKDIGFRFLWTTKNILDGKHTITLRVTSELGVTADFSYSVIISNRTMRRWETYHQWLEYRKSQVLQHKKMSAKICTPTIIILDLNDNSQGVEATLTSLEKITSEHRIIVLNNVNELVFDKTSKIDFTNTEEANAILGQLDKYSIVIDAGTQLAINAEYYISEYLTGDTTNVCIYGDDDKLSADGIRYDPFFKPKWSPDLLYSFNYIGGLIVVDNSIWQSITLNNLTGMYDLILRITTTASNQIGHISEILSHRIEEQVELSLTTLRQHFKKLEIDATAEPTNIANRVIYHDEDHPLVSILIPSKNLDYFQKCIHGLSTNTDYTEIEVVLIDTSESDDMKHYFSSVSTEFSSAVYFDHRYKDSFNFSMANNLGFTKTHSKFVLFLNDDTFPINKDWLLNMMMHIKRKEIGVVGAKLLYPNDTIQHSGITLGISGGANHGMRFFSDSPVDRTSPIMHKLSQVDRNVSAVTGACLLTRSSIFSAVNGFDETYFGLAFQDVDYCLKVLSMGYQVLYTPHSKLYHYESMSKNMEQINPTVNEVKALRDKWAMYIANDPYYNVNLTCIDESYQVRTETK